MSNKVVGWAKVFWLVMAFARLCPDSAAGQGPSARDFKEVQVTSPDGKIEVTVQLRGPLRYSVRVDNREIVAPSPMGLELADRNTFGNDVELFINSINRESHDSSWINPLGKRRTVRDHYEQLQLLLGDKSAHGQYVVTFRVYDDGVAFRYEIPDQKALYDFIVERELTGFKFPGDYFCFAGDHENKYQCSQEWEYRRRKLSEITPDSVVGLPVLVETPAAWVAIAEADLLDWAGMWIGGAPQESSAGASLNESSTEGSALLVAKLAPRLDGKGLVTSTAGHHSPWRVLMIGRQPGRLIESEIIHNLSTPSKLADSSWVKPGMMAWDHWWSGDSVMDTATIKTYIQLAADMGWPYQLIDWQWYGEPNKAEADITRVVPALDMDEVRRFAAERGVRLWLWLHSNDADRDDAWKKAFPLYEQWGIAGVKIDFMDRDDQEMVNWHEKITAAAAEHHLMVNFHGAFKTSGFDRTYPNQVTREGILGNEYNKWSDRVTPAHKLTLPFTRFLEGPADFTPGGFLNRMPEQFKTNTKPTQVQGTRAAELALLVCYDSPVCCVCEHPDHIRNKLGANFLKLVPTVWDDTQVLEGAVGEHLVMARQAGDDWYLGGMTVEPRTVDVPLEFLSPGKWKATLWKDGREVGANDAELLILEERIVSAADRLSVPLAPSGGFVAHLEKQ